MTYVNDCDCDKLYYVYESDDEIIGTNVDHLRRTIPEDMTQEEMIELINSPSPLDIFIESLGFKRFDQRATLIYADCLANAILWGSGLITNQKLGILEDDDDNF